MAVAEAKNDKPLDLFAVRSLLFLPASNPRAIAKAREAGADLVILDLEDAVKSEDKMSARTAAVDAVAAPWPAPVAIRINGVGTEWHSLDLDYVARSRAELIVVPRAHSAHLVRDIARTVGKPVLAMIETAAGVLAAAEIAHETAGLIAGTNDLRSDLHLPLDASRDPISVSLQLIVLAARAAGVAVFDGVFNNSTTAKVSSVRPWRVDSSASTGRASSTRTRSSRATALLLRASPRSSGRERSWTPSTAAQSASGTR